VISIDRRAWARGLGSAATLAAAAVLVAACSSSAKAGGGGGGSTSGRAVSAGGASVTVETHSGSMGTFLTDSAGHSLYLFVADKGGKSACSGSCATYWPPLTAKGAPKASGDAKASLLGTITRSDGSKQVTYAGHPLYTYVQDSAPGDTTGEGSTNFGAAWWLVAPSGQPIEGAAPASSSASSASGGGGGGGWA
jgi:predicted lipoprotein with Yx(FWY)xxD motif